MSARLAVQRALARVFRWKLSHHLVAGISRLVVARHRIGVLVVLFNERDEILLLRQALHTTSDWGLPGGWLKRREPPGRGALRELREETGLEATLGPVVVTSHEPEPPHVPIVYAARTAGGSLRLNFESIQARWCSIGDLPDSLDPFIREAIERAARWREWDQGAASTAGAD